jgi:hypothetical protein
MGDTLEKNLGECGEILTVDKNTRSETRMA